MHLFSGLRKLNQSGFDHVVVGVLFVVIFGVLGTAYIIMTHAASQMNYIYNGNGKCIDNAGNHKVAGNSIQIYTCNKTDAQVWKINGSSKNAGTIVNANGYCMTVPGSSKAERTYIKLEPCHSYPGQLWKVNTNHTITNPNSGMCLDNRWAHDINDNPLWTFHCNGTIAQEWLPEAVASPVPTVSLSASPSSIASGSSSTLTWSSKYATGCTAGGAWSGALPTSGSRSTGNLTSATTYSISCVGSQGSATARTTVQISSGGGGNGKLIFDSEFNGPAGSAPNPKKWQILGGSNPERWGVECFVNDRGHVYVNGHGQLVETATYNPGGVPCHNGSGNFESGGVTTGAASGGLFDFKYGTIVASIKVPCDSGAGAWPAFWSDGANWPKGGEIDYLEIMKGLGPDNAKQSLHGPQGSGHWDIGNNDFQSAGWCSAYHTYGAIWSPRKIEFTVDGKVTHVDTPKNVPSVGTWPFDSAAERILLDLQIGGSGGTPLTRNFPQSMLIDYVRVYN